MKKSALNGNVELQEKLGKEISESCFGEIVRRLPSHLFHGIAVRYRDRSFAMPTV